MSLTALTLGTVVGLLAQASPTWVVVTERGPEVPEAWSTALEAEVNRTVKMGKNPDASRGDLMVALGCASWDEQCAALVAETVGADIVLSLEVVRHGPGAWVSYQVTTKGAEQLRAKSRVKVPDRADAGLKMAKAVVHEAVTGEPATLLVVETNQVGARVLLDGDAVGTTPWVGVGVRAGDHEIRVEPESGAPIFRRVQVKDGDITNVALVVTVGPAPVEGGGEGDSSVTPASSGSGDTFFYLGVSLLGVAVAGVVVGGLLYGASWVLASTIPGGPGWCNGDSTADDCYLDYTQDEVADQMYLAGLFGLEQDYSNVNEYQAIMTLLVNGLAAVGGVAAGTGALLGVGGAGTLGYSYLAE